MLLEQKLRAKVYLYTVFKKTDKWHNAFAQWSFSHNCPGRPFNKALIHKADKDHSLRLQWLENTICDYYEKLLDAIVIVNLAKTNRRDIIILTDKVDLILGDHVNMPQDNLIAIEPYYNSK